MGLLAILMATLAPTVSHALAALDHSAHEAFMLCSIAPMQHETRHAASQTQGPGSHDDACGYCRLLTHMPAVIAPQSVLAHAVFAEFAPHVFQFASAPRIEPLNAAQPRAPPLLLS